MSTASTTQVLPAQEPANRITAARLDRFARIVVAAVAVAVGWVAGIFVFGLVSVRYGYWRGLGLTDEEIGGRVLAREQAKAQQQGGRDAQQQ